MYRKGQLMSEADFETVERDLLKKSEADTGTVEHRHQ